VRQFRVTTERRTQLIDITAEVRDAIGDAGGAAAALVFVPHTTAGVTINEGLDPRLPQDVERALERLVDDRWEWQHEDADGPNAPSHMRSSLVGPQLVVPVDGGTIALGTYQTIFFCEFDGPRERRVYVTPLA
jgi:secondary thiamine-phosphate synthase enzyme